MKILIIGNGIAGTTAAKEARKLSPEAEITIVGSESFYCYSRPRLIEVLGRESDLTDIYFYPPQWYAENQIQLYLNVKAKFLSPAKQKVVTDCGQELYFDKLLLANGSTPRVPKIEGVDHDGVFTIRTVEDVREVKNYAGHSAKSVVIGGGLLGLETANSLSKLGLEVTVIDRNPWLLSRQVDEIGSAILQEELAERGISVVAEGDTRLIKTPENASEGLTLHLQDDRQIETGMVVISAGIIPGTELANSGGLEINKGVVVDEYLNTSAQNIYAAGDVAEYNGKIYGIIPAAMEQGKIAGENMVAGNTKKYSGTVPSTSLKIAGIDLVSLGVIYPEENDKVITRLDKKAGIYKKAVLRDERLIGALLIGDKTEFPQINRLIRSNETIKDPESIFN